MGITTFFKNKYRAYEDVQNIYKSVKCAITAAYLAEIIDKLVEKDSSPTDVNEIIKDFLNKDSITLEKVKNRLKNIANNNNITIKLSPNTFAIDVLNDNQKINNIKDIEKQKKVMTRYKIGRKSDSTKKWFKKLSALLEEQNSDKSKIKKRALLEIKRGLDSDFKTMNNTSALNLLVSKKIGDKDFSSKLSQCLKNYLDKLNSSEKQNTSQDATLIKTDRNTPQPTVKSQTQILDSEETVPELDNKFKEEKIESNYNKPDKGYMTLWYNNKKRIWDIGERMKEAIRRDYPEKAEELFKLEPMHTSEKMLAILDGAKGGDINNLVIPYLNKALGVTYKSKEQLESFIKENASKIDINPEEIIKKFSYWTHLENSAIYYGRKIGQPRGKSDHGVDHATRAVNHIKDIANYINSHSNWFGIKVNNNEIRLAEYAILYHDSGRKNHMVDVFDETSAHRAEKQLAKRLNASQLKIVTDAIKNKDASIENKSNVAILVHESDCIEIQRVLQDPNQFSAKFMDLFKLFCKHNNMNENDALCSDEIKDLNQFAIKTYKSAVNAK